MAAPLQTSGKPLPEIPIESWPMALQQAITEVFSMMVGAQIGVAENQRLAPDKQVCGVIGIGGAFTAVLRLRCGVIFARKLAAQMLGVSPEEALAQCSDAIGE